MQFRWEGAGGDDRQPRAGLHDLFTAQALRTPTALAVQFADDALSYEELNERSNRLAHHLRELGVAPEDLVGVCVTKSIEMIVAVLGILKAGGAYVPLDPAYPPERIEYMLRDSKISMVLAQEDHRHLMERQGGLLFCMDADWSQVASLSSNTPDIERDPRQLAYVIYTSGSSGQPKAVQITHATAVAYLGWLVRNYSLDARDRVLNLSSLSFDPSVRDIFGPLSVGATLVIPKQEDARDPSRLGELLVRSDITAILSVVPSFIREAIRNRLPIERHSLRLLLTCGEALLASLAVDLQRFFGGHVKIFNQYGPTETTMTMAYFEFDGGADGAAVVPIGRVIDGVEAYVLDARLEAVPEGAIGELYIAGNHLARGYLARAGLTAERFVACPAGNGERMYRTGDLVRTRPDRNLEFVGRSDRQVKLRGQRIELAEIEATLLLHPSIRQVAVVVLETQGEQRLTAYVVSDEPLGKAALRGHLGARLPKYMCPSLWVMLPALPLTASGKIDRRALPIPSDCGGDDDYEPPSNPLERQIALLWAEVLQLDRPGVRDNFFDLGGHSLLATRLISRLRDSLGVAVPVRALFDAPTIRQLSASVEEQQRLGRAEAPELVPQSRSGVLPLSYAQERLWFLTQLGIASTAYNISTGFHLHGPLNVSALERSVRQLVLRHESLRTRFPAEEGVPRQRIEHDGGLIEHIDLSLLPAARRQREVQDRIRQERVHRFDVQLDSLLRVVLLKLTDAEHVLLLTMHHIVSDGWSTHIVTGELDALYSACVRGLEPSLASLPVQYADYAIWQRGWLRGEPLQQQLSYWKEQLAQAPDLLELPCDHPRPAVMSYRGAVLEFKLGKALGVRLSYLARAEGATLYMTLLAAYQLLLSRYSGQRDVVVGSPIAGRTHQRTEGLIGFFVNLLPLRVRLNTAVGFRDLLRQVRAVTLGAYANQELPFERLVAELHPRRNLSRLPIFQVLFAFQNFPQEQLRLHDLRCEPVASEVEYARYDLALHMYEVQGRLTGCFTYAQDLFEPITIARLAKHFETLLENIVAAPELPVSRLQMLSEAQRQRLIDGWDETSVPVEHASG